MLTTVSSCGTVAHSFVVDCAILYTAMHVYVERSVHIPLTSPDLISSQLTLFHMNKCTAISRRRGEPSRFTAFDAVRRGFDQSQWALASDEIRSVEIRPDEVK